METPQRRLWHLPVLLLAGLFVNPMPTASQCTVGPPAVMTYGTYIVVRKYLNMPYICNEVARMNVRGCYPTTGQTTSAYSTLTASAFTTATNPSCQWQCACATMTPTFATGTSDGLPVELMDFAIDGEGPAG